MHQYVFEENERSGDILFWTDTSASLKRILIALSISATLGVALGLVMGVIPYVRVTLTAFIAAISDISQARYVTQATNSNFTYLHTGSSTSAARTAAARLAN